MIYLGIDLGTSNTAVSWFNASRGKSLEFKLDQMGIGGVKTKEKTIPSAILVQEKETFLFGKYASQQAMENQPDNVAKSWKLFLGSGMKMKVRGREYDPEYFPKILLEFIRREVEKYFQEPVESAIFTLPASASTSMREALQRAISEAGFRTDVGILFLDEPTAALQYFLQLQRLGEIPESLLDLTSPKNVMVYDIGAGTVDVTINKVYLNEFQTLSTEQISISRFSDIAGDRFDELFAKNYLCNIIRRDYPDISESDLKSIMPVLINIAERTKVNLSNSYSVQKDNHVSTTYEDVEDSIGSIALGGTRYSLNATVSLKDYYDSIEVLLKGERNIFTAIDSAIERAQKVIGSNVKIDAILLNGGMSYAPFIREKIQELFPEAVFLDVFDYSSAVANGAAAYAYEKDISGYQMNRLTNIVPESIYLQQADGAMKLLIKAGTRLPYKNSKVYEATVEESTTEILYKFLKTGASENEYEALGCYSHKLDSLVDPGDKLDVGFEMLEDKRIKITLAGENIGTVVMSYSLDRRNGPNRLNRPIKMPEKLSKPLWTGNERMDIEQMVTDYKSALIRSVVATKEQMNELRSIESTLLRYENPFVLADMIMRFSKNSWFKTNYYEVFHRVYFFLGQILAKKTFENLESRIVDFLYEEYLKTPYYDKSWKIAIATAIGKSLRSSAEPKLYSLLKAQKKNFLSGVIQSLIMALGKVAMRVGTYDYLSEFTKYDSNKAIITATLWAMGRMGSRQTSSLTIIEALKPLKRISSIIESSSDNEIIMNALYWIGEVMDQRALYTTGIADEKTVLKISSMLSKKKERISRQNITIIIDSIIAMLSYEEGTQLVDYEAFLKKNREKVYSND